MNLKWIGAAFVILSCGGFGYYLAAQHKKEERMLRQLLAALDYMECELQYRLTPLPDLCRQAALQTGGELRQVLIRLAEDLESQISPDVKGCMGVTLAVCPPLPGKVRENMELLGNTLGRFDLEGQLKGLEALRQHCREDWRQSAQDRDVHLRNFQTLGLCAGAALAILFI